MNSLSISHIAQQVGGDAVDVLRVARDLKIPIEYYSETGWQLRNSHDRQSFIRQLLELNAS